MQIVTTTIQLSTKGFSDIHNVTPEIDEKLKNTGLRDGIVVVFVPGATAAVSTMEFEAGAVQDLKQALETLAPEHEHYLHNKRWQDGNGFSHVRAALLGPSLSVPFENMALTLGTWQQIIVLDFDNRPRNREIVLKFIGL